MDRNLDGVYFRVQRDGYWRDICFSDLTDKEREEVGKNKSLEWWKGMANLLADRLKEIGDEFGIIRMAG